MDLHMYAWNLLKTLSLNSRMGVYFDGENPLSFPLFQTYIELNIPDRKYVFPSEQQLEEYFPLTIQNVFNNYFCDDKNSIINWFVKTKSKTVTVDKDGALKEKKVNEPAVIKIFKQDRFYDYLFNCFDSSKYKYSQIFFRVLLDEKTTNECNKALRILSLRWKIISLENQSILLPLKYGKFTKKIIKAKLRKPLLFNSKRIISKQSSFSQTDL